MLSFKEMDAKYEVKETQEVVNFVRLGDEDESVRLWFSKPFRFSTRSFYVRNIVSFPEDHKDYFLFESVGKDLYKIFPKSPITMFQQCKKGAAEFLVVEPLVNNFEQEYFQVEKYAKMDKFFLSGIYKLGKDQTYGIEYLLQVEEENTTLAKLTEINYIPIKKVKL